MAQDRDTEMKKSESTTSDPKTPVVVHQPFDTAGDTPLFDIGLGDSTTLDEDTFNSPVTPQDRPVSLDSLRKEIDAIVVPPATYCQYEKYEISHRLEEVVLSREVFNLKVRQRIGSGANSYVCDAILSVHNGVGTEVAVKIPSSRRKTKILEAETEFLLSLREYRMAHRQMEAEFPFVECYGLYFLNQEDFKMIRRRDELPSLVMKKMDISLSDWARQCRQTALPDQVVIGKAIWWKLCDTLLHSLEILRDIHCIHCDYKTDNVMVLLDDTSFKVIDFSSSLSADRIKKLPQMTPQFTPPELMDLKNGHRQVSYCTDLFSCGLVLLNAATGMAPYETCNYDQFYLLSLVKDNMALDVLDRESANILDANPDVGQLIRMIVKDRCDLDTAVKYYRSKTPLDLSN